MPRGLGFHLREMSVIFCSDACLAAPSRSFAPEAKGFYKRKGIARRAARRLFHPAGGGGPPSARTSIFQNHFTPMGVGESECPLERGGSVSVLPFRGSFA